MGHNNFFRHFPQLCAVLLEGFPHLRSRFGNKEPVQLLQLPVTFFASKIMGDFVSDFVNRKNKVPDRVCVLPQALSASELNLL